MLSSSHYMIFYCYRVFSKKPKAFKAAGVNHHCAHYVFQHHLITKDIQLSLYRKPYSMKQCTSILPRTVQIRQLSQGNQFCSCFLSEPNQPPSSGQYFSLFWEGKWHTTISQTLIFERNFLEKWTEWACSFKERTDSFVANEELRTFKKASDVGEHISQG